MKSYEVLRICLQIDWVGRGRVREEVGRGQVGQGEKKIRRQGQKMGGGTEVKEDGERRLCQVLVGQKVDR